MKSLILFGKSDLTLPKVQETEMVLLMFLDWSHSIYFCIIPKETADPEKSNIVARFPVLASAFQKCCWLAEYESKGDLYTVRSLKDRDLDHVSLQRSHAPAIDKYEFKTIEDMFCYCTEVSLGYDIHQLEKDMRKHKPAQGEEGDETYKKAVLLIPIREQMIHTLRQYLGTDDPAKRETLQAEYIQQEKHYNKVERGPRIYGLLSKDNSTMPQTTADQLFVVKVVTPSKAYILDKDGQYWLLEINDDDGEWVLRKAVDEDFYPMATQGVVLSEERKECKSIIEAILHIFEIIFRKEAKEIQNTIDDEYSKEIKEEAAELLVIYDNLIKQLELLKADMEHAAENSAIHHEISELMDELL